MEYAVEEGGSEMSPEELDRIVEGGVSTEVITVEGLFSLCYFYGLEATVDGDRGVILFSPLKE